MNSKKRDDVALDRAVKNAKEVGIRTHPQWMDQVLDQSLSLGTTLISSFFLTPLPSAATGVSYGLAITKWKPSRLAWALATRERRLRNLAKAGPGHIEWE